MSIAGACIHQLSPLVLLSNPSLVTLLRTTDLGWRYEGAVYTPNTGAVYYGKKIGERLWKYNPTGYEFTERFIMEELTRDDANRLIRDSL